MERGLILHPSYRVGRERAVIQLHGRLESGPAFLIEDDRFRPYFFVRTQQAPLLPRHDGMRIEETELHDFAGEPVSRVEVAMPSEVSALRDKLEDRGVVAFEADIRFPYRYLIDHGVRTAIAIEGEHEVGKSGAWRYHNPILKPADCRPELRVLSLDIETSLDAGLIFSIAYVQGAHEEVHLLSSKPVAGAIVYESEKQLLIGALARLRDLDPDILVGWNVVDFDLRVIEQRCSDLKLTAGERRIGRGDGKISILKDQGFTRQSRAIVPGRMVLDGIPLVRDALRLPDYRLETVARSVLGRGKLIDSEAPDSGEEIQRLYREEPEALVRYNLEDSKLVLEILEHEGLLDLTLERSQLSGMQLDRVGASIASFDLVYLPELRRAGIVAPSVARDRKSAPVRGGAVLDSQPGIFKNVAVYDFKSLYPSLIRTFSLDPLAHVRARTNQRDVVEAPNGARFAKQEAILPGVIERFTERREAAKERGDRHADQAIKIMMNACFGVLGSASCRFFDAEVANAITSFGQQTLGWTRDAFEAEGVRVIYGDTDSVFVCLRADEPGDAAAAEAEKLRESIERGIAQRISRDYGVVPQLTLELERIYDRFFMPRVRGGSGGSKKRYAGWIDGRLSIVGLESVRRDWPAVAKRLQEGMLERLFRDDDLLPFTREIAEQVRTGELDAELVYVKRVRKDSLDRYTASTPPHVQAARKAGGAQRGIIRYVITQTGPEPVLPGRPLPPGIDRRHYIEKVLRPVADAILPEIGHSFDEALGKPQQLTLL
jgi:DNA polymerase-2